MNVELPDGSILEDIPEGTTRAQIAERLQRAGRSVPQEWLGPKAQPSAAKGITEELLKTPQGQFADVALPLVSGAVAPIAAGLAGIAGTMLPGPEGQGAEVVKRVENALAYRPQTAIGKAVNTAASYPFEKLREFGQAVGGTVLDATGSPLAATAAQTAIEAAPMAIGMGAKKVAPGGSTPAQASARTAAQSRNAARDAITADLQERGYRLPPSQVNPTRVQEHIEGFANKTKTEQQLSIHNQEVTNAGIRSDFGFAPDTPMTLNDFRNYRQQEAQAYDVARNTGTILPSQTFVNSVNAAARQLSNVAGDRPTMVRGERAQVLADAKALTNGPLSTSAAVDLIRQMRYMADEALNAATGKRTDVGNAYERMAKALESELEDHITRTGQPPQIVTRVKEARANIARSHAVEEALTAAGNVDARVLAKQWDEGRGAPLTGNVLRAAQLGAVYKGAARVPEKIGGIVSPLGEMPLALAVKALTSGGIGAYGAYAHNPYLMALAAVPLVKPVVRSAIASGPYQRMFVNMPNYGPTLANKLLALQEMPTTQLAEMGLGQPEQK